MKSNFAAKSSHRVAMPHRTGYTIRFAEEITCLQSVGNYTWVHFENGDKYLVCKLLSKVLDKLDDKRFLRTHRSYAINAELLKDKVQYRPESSCLIYNGFEIQVSKRYRNAIALMMAS